MKNRSGGVDQRLRQRVEQYLSSSPSNYVDLSSLALELQRIHRMEYGRRNQTAFRIQVEKVYDVIRKEADLNQLEEQHLAKRAKQEAADDISSDSSSSSDVVLDSTVKGHMNASLTSLYRKEPAPPAVGPAPPGSVGGWFIDRGREDATDLIDLCGDEPTANAKASVAVEKERSRKKTRKIAQRSEVNTQPASDDKRGEVKSKSFQLQIPAVKFEDVGGNEATLTDLCRLLVHMRHPEVYLQLGMVPPRGFLLHGPPGCGKTLLAQAVAGELQLPMLKVSAPELVSGVSGESEQKLRELFDQALSSAPCILFIDEIDAITPKRETASKDMERRIVSQLLTCMDDLNSSTVTAQVLVIGATNRPDSLDPALRRAGRFDREICLGIPDQSARLQILKTLCRKLKLAEDFDYSTVARLTPGYVGADLMALSREAAMNAVNRILMDTHRTAERPERTPDRNPDYQNSLENQEPGIQKEPGTPQDQKEAKESQTQGALSTELCVLLKLLKECEALGADHLASLSVSLDDFRSALDSLQPSALREGFATVPGVTWSDIGALKDVREELTMAILAPVRSPEQFSALGLSSPSGVLLAGPPGCGKTLLAKAVANESGLNFISVKGPELLNMYVGESERAVRQVFQRGCNSAPCVIFFDEIDALCPRRSDHESGASVRVVNQLLTEMDGLQARRQVFIMAATNRPDIIDPAVLRPGRLDKTLYVGLPPPEDRHAILITITKGGTKPPLEPDVNLREIATDDRCDGFSGADLTALVREASLNALRFFIASQNTSTSSGGMASIRVSRQNFEDALKKLRPSVSKKDQKMYEELREKLNQ